MNIQLFPLEKAVADGHVILLGTEKSAVEKALGRGEQSDNKSYYFDSCLCIEYDDFDRVSFIEVSCSQDGIVTPVIYGTDVSETDAEHIFKILSDKNNGEIDDSENGYSYTFYNISFGIYREITPNDYCELVNEMKANGNPVENNPDIEADFWKSTHWSTIGIGVKNYYS